MDEAEIISNVLAGDKEAYAILVEKYHRGLYTHLYTVVKDRDAAHDLTQTSFIKAYTSLSRYNTKFRFSTWLYRIATNDALKYLRKSQRIGLDEIPELPDTYDPKESQNVEHREARVRQAVAKLPLKYQTIIGLYYWQDQSYAEIAHILGIPIGTVRTWLSRAKQQLQIILGTYE